MAITKFNGHTYWGTPKSAEGWETKVGPFYILDHKRKFMRYIAHSRMNPLAGERDKIAELAEGFGFATSPVFQTYNDIYNFEKFFEVYIVEQGAEKYLKEKEEFASKTKSPAHNPSRLLVSISQQRPYDAGRSTALDINFKVKSIHKELMLGLERILLADATTASCQPRVVASTQV